jgi:2-amino-4-hydroxy-6-hydroxymethyldihydropteridine diphosphokinase
MAIVYLGLGSNLGDRAGHIDRAIQDMAKCGIKVCKMSAVIETDPVGGPPQGKFLNAVVECETQLSPAELLKILKDIERSLGRVKTVTDGPREIDLDILMYDQLKLDVPGLTIPHPKMRSREFVMAPLREIAPQLAKDIEQCAS